ncbi:MAG: ornithine cyclodeaminase family protein, partial [Bacteroidota bacterium]
WNIYRLSANVNIVIWGRNAAGCQSFQQQYSDTDYHIRIAPSVQHLAKACKTIITATATRQPLLHTDDLLPGTHITAIGSDTPEKQELASDILAKADRVVVDSRAQCRHRGEWYQANKQIEMDKSKVCELGQLIQSPTMGRSNNNMLTIADLTGVAVQDIMIATGVLGY